MVTPMLRPDLFGGLATHAGDALFEVCYLPDFRASVRALRDRYGGSFDAFWDDFRSRPAFTKESDGLLLNDWSMAACYSCRPGRDSTAAVLTRRRGYWCRRSGPTVGWDPVRMVSRYADALCGLQAIYIDAGTRDEAYLDLGARPFRRALAAIGVIDLRFELFEAGHFGSSTLPLSLRTCRAPGAVRAGFVAESGAAGGCGLKYQIPASWQHRPVITSLSTARIGVRLTWGHSTPRVCLYKPQENRVEAWSLLSQQQWAWLGNFRTVHATAAGATQWKGREPGGSSRFGLTTQSAQAMEGRTLSIV